MKKITMLAAAGLAAVSLTACASKPSELQAQYVSDMQYKDYDCDQLMMEEDRISRRVSALQAEIESNASGDAVATGVGLVLFWPALFFIEGDGAEAQEYSRLKGEHEAIRRASIQKKCGFQITPLDEQVKARAKVAEKDEEAGPPSPGQLPKPY